MAEEKRKISAPSICAHGMGLSLDVPAICMRRKRGLSFRGLGLAYSARKAAFVDALRENDGVIKLWFRVEHERMIFRTSFLIAISKTYESVRARVIKDPSRVHAKNLFLVVAIDAKDELDFFHQTCSLIRLPSEDR